LGERCDYFWHSGLMDRSKQVLAFAQQLAAELESDMVWNTGGEYWRATEGKLQTVMMARATSGLQFLREYAGETSSWMDQANAVYISRGVEAGTRAIGGILRAWVDQVENGVAEIVGSRAWGEVDVVSTDLMEQVRRLLNDKDIHVAVPIVLCGASLEIALRATAEAKQLTLEAKPSISAWAALLKRADLLTKQDVKDFESCGGIRNAAAHGEFDELSSERAGLMEQQTNLLLSRLADIQRGTPTEPQ
jgi:hypothetical protein